MGVYRDYRASWIRDSSFTLYALIRLGFTYEANGAFSLPSPIHLPFTSHSFLPHHTLPYPFPIPIHSPTTPLPLPPSHSLHTSLPLSPSSHTPPHPTAYMDFIFERVKDKNPDGSLNIMYTIHGEKLFPEEELGHLDGHKGSRPVR